MRNLYPRLAATNLKKNRRFYLPYLLACIVIVALFCIMLTLASDPYLGQMQHGGSVSQVLGFGVFIMALFSAIILFYTNSTFTKQRKREFAIYNILGMEKRHISYVLFWESLYTAAMALFFGLVAAGVFSKLLQLVLVRLIGGEATFGLNIRLMSIGYTVVFFGALFLLLLLNTIRIIHLSNPVQLLRAGSEGEREPRSKWILALLGAVCLAAGYLISLRTNVALYAIQNFFPAVILVIIGTYLTFIALSVVVLKALRKNRRYYYKTSHFAITALTLACGFKGGEVVPSFFVGATFGCVVGPLLGLPAEFAAAVGLVSIFCGATNALIPSILLGFELFSGAGLELIALGCGICYMLSGHHGLYSSQTFVTNKLRSEYMSHKWRVRVKKAEE